MTRPFPVRTRLTTGCSPGTRENLPSKIPAPGITEALDENVDEVEATRQLRELLAFERPRNRFGERTLSSRGFRFERLPTQGRHVDQLLPTIHRMWAALDIAVRKQFLNRHRHRLVTHAAARREIRDRHRAVSPEQVEHGPDGRRHAVDRSGRADEPAHGGAQPVRQLSGAIHLERGHSTRVQYDLYSLYCIYFLIEGAP